MANTQVMADNNTRPMNMEETNRLILRKNVIFEGKKDKYEIFANNRIGAGGESQVYLAKRVSDGEQVVAKIYDEYADTPLSRRNRKTIVNFLSENSDYQKTHIMPLLDNGNILMESDDGADFSKPIDIIPFCKDGELKRCDYKMLREKVIPEILHGMNVLHKNNLVHRDIKPNNIYMLNGVVVIADFGTSGEISSNDNHGYIGTQKKRGTVGYTAPEVWQGYAVVASDYYSLGCTIATLYKGEHVYQNLIKDKEDAKISKAINTMGLPLECSDAETDLQMLVDALVMNAETMRAGYDAVKSWIENPKSFVNEWKHKQRQEDEIPPLGFNFEGKMCNDEAELTDAILKQWNAAKRYLYKGTIAGFFNQKNPTLADKTIGIVEGKETARNEDLGLAMFLHYLNTANKPKCPIYWNEKTYEKLSDISTAINNKEAVEQSITAMLKDKFLSWKFNNTHGTINEDTINAIKEAEDITADYPQLGYYTFMYRFLPENEKNNQTSDEIFKELTKISGDWYEKAQNILKNDKTFAYLLCRGHKMAVLEIKKSLTGKFISDDSVSDLTLLYKLFETVCEDKAVVREHFLYYGPQAYLYWFQQNLNLYSFNSKETKEIEKLIKNVKIEKKSITDIFNSFLSLRQYLKDFMPLLQNNYLLTYMGLRTLNNTEGITTNNTHAFFVRNFFGIKVPVGYLKSIGM